MSAERWFTPDQFSESLERLSRSERFLKRLREDFNIALERFENDPEFRDLMFQRFMDGETKIGPCDLFDGREWRFDEAEQEFLDAIVYEIFQFVRDERTA